MDADLDDVVTRALQLALDDDDVVVRWLDRDGVLVERPPRDGALARVTVTDDTLEQPGGLVDAFLVSLDHADGRGVDVVVPYVLAADGAPQLGERLVRPRRARQSATRRT